MTAEEKLAEIRRIIGRHVMDPALVDIMTEILDVIDDDPT